MRKLSIRFTYYSKGDGPLHPEPIPLGVIMLSDNPAEMDYALALLMGFDPEKLPLIKNALELFPNRNKMFSKLEHILAF